MERLLIKNIALGTGGTQSIAVTAASANDDLFYPAYRLTGSPAPSLPFTVTVAI